MMTAGGRGEGRAEAAPKAVSREGFVRIEDPVAFDARGFRVLLPQGIYVEVPEEALRRDPDRLDAAVRVVDPDAFDARGFRTLLPQGVSVEVPESLLGPRAEGRDSRDLSPIGDSSSRDSREDERPGLSFS